MNPVPQRLFNIVIIGLAAGFVILAIGARWYVDSLETNRQTAQAQAQNATQTQLTEVQQQVAALQRATDALVAANQTVAKQLATEQSKRIAAEQARASDAARAAQQISQLKEDLDSAKAPNLTAIVSQWRPRVAQVTCTWNLSDGSIEQSTGSGVLMIGGSAPAVTTNRHVVVYNGQIANKCSVKFPDDPAASIVSAINIAPSSPTTDWAQIYILKPSPYVQSLATASPNRCINKPAAGASIVILGYPSVGAQGDITATEGIISGFEGSYFISSAKVERGNSGGAAILTQQNCYLGIPSYVGAGQIESLARILDQHVIFQ